MEKLRSVHSLTLNDRVQNQTECGARTPVTEFLKILGQIHRSLKIFLSRWGLELPGDIDPECYENLHGYIEGHDLSAILDLANGQAR